MGYHPVFKSMYTPESCTTRCSRACEWGQDAMRATGCVKQCIPTKSDGNSKCWCHLAKRISCFHRVDDPTIVCDQYKTLMDSGVKNGQADGSCGQICANQLAAF